MNPLAIQQQMKESLLRRDIEWISQRREGMIYCTNWQQNSGKYVSIVTHETHTAIEDNDIAIISASPMIELRLSYIASKDQIAGFRLKKIRQDPKTKQWIPDGEISISSFTLSELHSLCELLSKISFKDIASRKLIIDNFAVENQEVLEKQLRALLATEPGRRMISTISKTQSVSDKDIINLAMRKRELQTFKNMLTDDDYFEQMRTEWGIKQSGLEAVWQYFFEQNKWIFGYGLSLISCNSFDFNKLEQRVADSTVLSPGGKRVDALLKTRSAISSLLFCEIKTHKTDLVNPMPYREPDTFQVSSELSGAVSQVQYTIHRTVEKYSSSLHQVVENDGTVTGEQVSLIHPKGIVVIGKLSDMATKEGLQFSKFASFQLFRTSMHNPEIITFDELYERARFITEDLMTVHEVDYSKT